VVRFEIVRYANHALCDFSRLELAMRHNASCFIVQKAKMAEAIAGAWTAETELFIRVMQEMR
jgi:hypothetical protein